MIDDKYLSAREQHILELEAKVSRLEQENTLLKEVNNQLHSVTDDYLTAFLKNESALAISRFGDAVFLYMNDACLNILGYKWDEIIGKSSWELHTWADFTEREEVLNQISKKGYIRNFECKFGRKDGSIAYTIMSSTIVNVDDMKCMVIAATDITDQKKNEV
jgi:PAS domain S-box-containing protein